MQVWANAHPWPFGLNKKVKHSNCADKHILIELSELILFDTQDELRCWRNEIYILWLTSSPCDNNSGERYRAHGPSCCCYCFGGNCCGCGGGGGYAEGILVLTVCESRATLFALCFKQ